MVILTTIPPRAGMVEKAKEFAEVQRKIAADFKLPLIDYQAEILKRRPDDWNGSLPKFKEYAKDGTRCRRSSPATASTRATRRSRSDYSAEALNENGYQLRNVRDAARLRRRDYRNVLAAKGMMLTQVRLLSPLTKVCGMWR